MCNASPKHTLNNLKSEISEPADKEEKKVGKNIKEEDDEVV